MKFKITHNYTLASTTFSLAGEMIVTPKVEYDYMGDAGIITSTTSIGFYKPYKCHVNMMVVDEYLYSIKYSDTHEFLASTMEDLLREGFKDLEDDCRDSAFNNVKNYAYEWATVWSKATGISVKDAEACIIFAADKVFDDPEYAEKKFAAGGYVTPPPSLLGSNPDPIPNLDKSCNALSEVVPYPRGCGKRGRDILTKVIIYLNDKAGWSRNDIADWLESLDVDLSVDYE